MRVLCIDVETTGLNPNQHQVLEVGAVLWDTEKPKSFEETPKFHCYVEHQDIVGQPYALAMNALTLGKISGYVKQDGLPADDVSRLSVRENLELYPSMDFFLKPYEVAPHFKYWLEKICGIIVTISETSVVGGYAGITVAGKNFDKFDRQFLEKLPEWEHHIRMNRAAFDPAHYYWRQTDEKLPSLAECAKRAGLSLTKAHSALHDAWDTKVLLEIAFDKRVKIEPF